MCSNQLFWICGFIEQTGYFGQGAYLAMSEVSDVIRRNRPGTKREEWCQWPDEVFDEVDSTLAVQQFIQQLIRKDFRNVDAILTPPEGQDQGVWKYEHLRQFCMELNGLAILLQDHCTPETCAQMTATEQWIFLCAAHKTPKEVVLFSFTCCLCFLFNILINSLCFFDNL
uniref:MOB-like protein phocein n=1 Tax=Mesocestoides corti TaxID=53468 RepID=A0A5K3F174_MESCO